MPVYQFICEKHGAFEKITIKAEWENIRCPKCNHKSRVDNKNNLDPKKTFGKSLSVVSSSHLPA